MRSLYLASGSDPTSGSTASDPLVPGLAGWRPRSSRSSECQHDAKLPQELDGHGAETTFEFQSGIKALVKQGGL